MSHKICQSQIQLSEVYSLWLKSNRGNVDIACSLFLFFSQSVNNWWWGIRISGKSTTVAAFEPDPLISTGRWTGLKKIYFFMKLHKLRPERQSTCQRSHTRKVKLLGKKNMCTDTATLSVRLWDSVREPATCSRCRFPRRCLWCHSTEMKIRVFHVLAV